MCDEPSTVAEIEHIFQAWHAAVKAQDVDAITALYAHDAVIETPAAVVLDPEHENGVVQGRDAIRSFFAANFAARKGEGVFEDWWRSGNYHAKDGLLVWEYPRHTPAGDQTDLVESMDIRAGLIAVHRVYWGWNGFKKLLTAIESQASRK